MNNTENKSVLKTFLHALGIFVSVVILIPIIFFAAAVILIWGPE